MDTSKRTARTTRVQRGIRLHRERGHEIERVAINTYRVPSCTEPIRHYVSVDPEFEFCTCPDHRPAKAVGQRCKHFHAASIEASKRRAARRRRLAS